MTRLTLGDDLPKENPWQEDRLGYRPFAERLAKVIRALQAPNGYVIGLHGKWGSGKSTALNFVKAFLKKYNDETENEADRIHLVDFRPWIISGHQDLIAAFFKVLSVIWRCFIPRAGSTWREPNLTPIRETASP